MRLWRVLLLVGMVCAPGTTGAVHAQQTPSTGVLPPPSAGGPPLLVPAQGNPYATEELDSLMAPQSEVESIEGVLKAESHPEGTLAETITPTAYWYHPAYWFGYDPWGAGVELGINGSQGNNDVFSMRIGAHLKRETKRWKFDSSLVYNKNHANGIETQNNGKVDSRLDRIIGETRYTWFVLENMIYDEFQSYDIQLSLNSGLGYQWIKTPITDLMTRLGAGATREFGGVDNDWEPQALLGLDLAHSLTATQRLTAKVDYFPEWEDRRNYRVVSDLGWQVDLDRPKNVSLKVSVIDRYDSTPNGREANNLDYAVVLIWKL